MQSTACVHPACTQGEGEPEVPSNDDLLNASPSDATSLSVWEISYLINAGMTDLEAIEAATANGPDTLGPQAPHTGQLREGYDADVITLDRNPLDDRSVWGDADRVTGVWQRGRRVKG